MRGAQRRNFQAQMALKYCSGNARLTETVFGWGRNNVELGLAENLTGIICIGAQAALGGAKRWEERFPQAAETLRQIASAHAKPRPQFSDNDCLHLGFQQQKQSSNCNSRDILTNKCLLLAQWHWYWIGWATVCVLWSKPSLKKNSPNKCHLR